MLHDYNLFYEINNLHIQIHIKGKALPVQAWTGAEGSRSLRLLDFKAIGT